MKRLFIVFALAIFLSSCVMYSGVYKLSLQEVESPQNLKEKSGESRRAILKPDGSSNYVYEDDLMKIIWEPGTTQFGFKLYNKSSLTIKIIWDEASYVNIYGESQKIFHSGIKFTDKSNSQPLTTVVKGTSVDEVIMPVDNANYVSGQYGGWSKIPLFRNTAASKQEMDDIKNSYLGKVVKIYLPIKTEDKTNEYLFTFQIDGFIEKKSDFQPGNS